MRLRAAPAARSWGGRPVRQEALTAVAAIVCLGEEDVNGAATSQWIDPNRVLP